MTIALVQMNSTIGAFADNASAMARIAEKAVITRVSSGRTAPDLIVFPELSLCGYPPMDLLEQHSFVQGTQRALEQLVGELARGAAKKTAVAVGHVGRNTSGSGALLVNAISVVRDSELLFSQAKTLLPTYDVFDEARYFEPAQARALWTYASSCGVHRIGFSICEDMWWNAPHVPGCKYSIDPVQELIDKGADILVVASASPFVAGKPSVRTSLAAGYAKKYGIPVLYCNAVGANDSLVFDGRSFAMDASGDIVGACGWSEEILFTQIGQSSIASDAALLQDIDSCGPAAAGLPALDVSDSGNIAEIHQALLVGIRDYMAKTGFKTALVGMSGGIDSALVGVLAAEALGANNVTAITMPSRFSSDGSVNDSIELCRRAGIRLDRMPIETIFTAYLDMLAVPFAGRPFDSAEENIQARIRGAILMAWSNKFGSLLLATGNKSELAVGYCTLYGDMCGALAPIGDLYKTEVYKLCSYLNERAEAQGKLAPVPREIIDKVPSAELRLDQKDQDSLPPYDILDSILRLYIEGEKDAEEIIADGFDAALVRRVLSMCVRAEYKRRQAAPVIKISARAFGIGRRLPLARAAHEIL